LTLLACSNFLYLKKFAELANNCSTLSWNLDFCLFVVVVVVVVVVIIVTCPKMPESLSVASTVVMI
jgi:hypothetical protein